MIVIEIKEPIDYEKVVNHDDNLVILKELATRGNADAICRLGVMWYTGKFEEVNSMKRSKKMQMMVSQYYFEHIPESGEANYYLYKLCDDIKYLEKSVMLEYKESYMVLFDVYKNEINKLFEEKKYSETFSYLENLEKISREVSIGDCHYMIGMIYKYNNPKGDRLEGHSGGIYHSEAFRFFMLGVEKNHFLSSYEAGIYSKFFGPVWYKDENDNTVVCKTTQGYLLRAIQKCECPIEYIDLKAKSYEILSGYTNLDYMVKAYELYTKKGSRKNMANHIEVKYLNLINQLNQKQINGHIGDLRYGEEKSKLITERLYWERLKNEP